MKHTILYIALSFLTLLPLGAQTAKTESGILVRDVKVYRNGTNIDVSCVFDLEDFKLRSNKSITYIPYLTRGGRLGI